MILSTRSIVLISLIALLAVAGQWSDALSSQAWRILAAGWLLALVVDRSRTRTRRPRLRRALPEVCFLGVPLDAVLELHSAERHPLDIELADDVPDTFDVTGQVHRVRLEPAASARVTMSLVPRTLGPASWSRIHARALGPLRLAWWPLDYELPARVRVMPDHLDAGEHRAGSASTGRRERSGAGSGTELLGLREYRRGDPMRRIDWKATARRGVPIVREYQAEEQLELVMVLDTGRQSAVESGRLTRLGHYVNVAARLAERALHHGDHAALVAFAHDPHTVMPFVRGHAGLVQLRNALGRLRSTERESNPLAAALRVRTLARHRALVVLLTDVDEGAAADQLLRACALLGGHHMVVVAALADEDVLAMRWQTCRDWRTPHQMLAAQEISREQRRTVARLARAGARPVMARPADIDTRVLDAYADIRTRRRA